MNELHNQSTLLENKGSCSFKKTPKPHKSLWQTGRWHRSSEICEQHWHHGEPSSPFPPASLCQSPEPHLEARDHWTVPCLSLPGLSDFTPGRLWMGFHSCPHTQTICYPADVSCLAPGTSSLLGTVHRFVCNSPTPTDQCSPEQLCLSNLPSGAGAQHWGIPINHT